MNRAIVAEMRGQSFRRQLQQAADEWDVAADALEEAGRNDAAERLRLQVAWARSGRLDKLGVASKEVLISVTRDGRIVNL